MGQNEVQNQQPGSDQFIGKAAAIAQVIAVESAVDFARKEVKDRCPVSTSGSPNVAQPDALAGELVHVPALRGARVVKKLAQGEIAGVRRGKIEEMRFLLAITEVAEGFEIFRADHSERMSSMISGSTSGAGAAQHPREARTSRIWSGLRRPSLSRVANTCQRESEPPYGRPAGHCPISSKGTSGWKKYQKKNSASP